MANVWLYFCMFNNHHASMATIKVKLNTYRPNQSGKYSLVIQLIHRRERCLLPTGIKIEPEFFDAKRCRIRYRKENPYSCS